MPSAPRRVVVTGLGVITPLGPDCATTWTRLIAGESGLRRLPDEHFADIFDFKEEPIPPGIKHGGPHPPVSLSTQETTGEPMVDLALHAAKEAVQDAAGDSGFEIDPYRAGVVFGTSKAGFRSFDQFMRSQQVETAEKHNNDSGKHWTHFLSDTPALMLAKQFNFKASALCPVAACATGLVAVQRAAHFIQHDQCDVMLAGSSDASLLPIIQSSYHRLGVLARNFEDPAIACRPFDDTREGFLIGEGAAVLILEEAEHAAARGATPYAEWLGGNQTADTLGLTQLDSESPALRHLLTQLPRQCSFDWNDVSYLNLHGTSTVMNDVCEVNALQRVLGTEAERIPTSSLKGSLGHLLGAAGSVETALTILALKHRQLPGNPTLKTPFEGCRLNLIRKSQEVANPYIAVKLSLGFGGHLAAGVFRAWQ
ncbi:MAG: beta-ketoacyl-[acyl-carrier-protein] synthase family protein [Planctomycetaceae bacterium]|jgi:3-oxoacyl-[acyl-carrier-protein] synthase II|nr:beta-ketoacyl-[acyl-carrier-protein] synthase family protein [Planctomycetaceae bacterium]